MADNAIVKIFRFDPSVDKEPRIETYAVPPEGWKDHSVLETLRYIYDNLDAGLSFREQCYQRLCGACTVVVNKKPVLACDTPSSNEMLIEPVTNFKLIKDLVVDLSIAVAR